MNNVRLLQVCFLSLILSCTACMPAKYKTYIVGNWQPVQLNLSDIQRFSFVPDTSLALPSEENRQVLDQLKQELLKQKEKGTTFEELQSQMRNAIGETQTTYTFASNGTGSRETRNGKSVTGIWQLKKRGKALTLTSSDDNQVFTLNIDSLSAKRMVIRNPYLPSGMRLTYIKQ